MTKSFLNKMYREILFQKVALSYLLHFAQHGSSQNILNTHVCTTISTIRKLHGPASIWERAKHKVMTTSNLYKICRRIFFRKAASGYLLHFVQNESWKSILNQLLLHNNPLPESCVGLFITLCTEWILKNTN